MQSSPNYSPLRAFRVATDWWSTIDEARPSFHVLTITSKTYGYDSLDRITSSSYPGGWGSITYTDDGTGNRLTMVQGGTTTTYTYGMFNGLTKAVTGSQHSNSLKRDAQALRLS